MYAQEIDLISLTWAVETSLSELGSDDFLTALTLSRKDVRDGGGSMRSAVRMRASWTDLRTPLLVALAQLAHEIACTSIGVQAWCAAAMDVLAGDLCGVDTTQTALLVIAVRAQSEALPLPELVTCVANIGQRTLARLHTRTQMGPL